MARAIGIRIVNENGVVGAELSSFAKEGFEYPSNGLMYLRHDKYFQFHDSIYDHPLPPSQPQRQSRRGRTFNTVLIGR